MSMKDVSRQLADLNAKVDALNTKVDEGFNASKVRDEELLRLTRFGLEADEVLGDAMNRRFDEAGQKHQEQIDFLREVLKNRVTGR